MHLDFAVVADYALVDQSGKMSVLGIFQHIWVPQFPAMHPRLHLVLRLKGKRTEVGEHQVQIKLLDENDGELLCGSGTVNFAEPPAGVTEIEAAAVLVFDVPFPRAGQYRFEITVDGDRKANVPITAVSDVFIFGNHSPTMFSAFHLARINGKPAAEKI